MARITDVILTDVRCFEGRQQAKMGRITLLVGENSSGKSTFLACYHALARMANLYDLTETNHFDATPFGMGPFFSIVRDGGTEFGVSARFANHIYESLSFIFGDHDGMPVDRQVRLSFPESSNSPRRNLTLLRPPAPDVALRVAGPGFTFDLGPGEVSYRSVASWLSNYVRDRHLPYGGDVGVYRKRTGETKESPRYASFARFSETLLRLEFPDPLTFLTVALDPRLPERKRVYMGLPGRIDPENSALLGFLAAMGRRFSLWDDVRIDPADDGLGSSVMVNTPNGRRNLVDVGYGVHSLLMHLLPTLYRTPANATLLLQQPEVHVHPRTQADLAQWMAESKLGFAVETHSDHLVDRFRICVMKGILDPEDLSILYFERSNDQQRSNIHSLTVDADGNLDGAPDGYRMFFLQETHSLLGFE